MHLRGGCCISGSRDRREARFAALEPPEDVEQFWLGPSLLARFDLGPPYFPKLLSMYSDCSSGCNLYQFVSRLEMDPDDLVAHNERNNPWIRSEEGLTTVDLSTLAWMRILLD